MNISIGCELSSTRNQLVRSGDISLSGKLVVVGQSSDDEKDGIGLYEVSGSPKLVRRWAKTAKSASFSCDEKLLAYVDRDVVMIYDLVKESVQTHSTRLQLNPAYWCSFASDAPRLLVGGDQTTILWDTTREEVIWETSMPQQSIYGAGAGFSRCAITSDGRRVAITGSDKSVIVYDVDNGVIVAKLASSESARSVVFDESGQHLALVTDAGALLVWNLDEATSRLHEDVWNEEFTGKEVVAFVPGRDALALGVKSGSVRLLSIRDTGGVWESQNAIHRNGVVALKFSGSGERMLSVGGRSAIVWDVT